MLINPKLLQRIKEKKQRLEKLRPFSAATFESLRKRMLVEWTYNSNAIEGNTLTLRETQLILEEGVTIGGKSLREHFEAINHGKAIEYIERLVGKKAKISQEVILALNSIILKDIDNAQAGRWRRVQVRITGSNYLPPSPTQVPALMKEFALWLSRNKTMEPVKYAALAHFKLVHIHPFVDGNGRCARLLMNLLLFHRGFPTTVILKTERKSYYFVLEKAHEGNFTFFANFIARSIDRALSIYLEALEPVKPEKEGERKYFSLNEAQKFTPYSQEYLSLLARKGRIEAVKFGRNWMINKKAIYDYLESIGNR